MAERPAISQGQSWCDEARRHSARAHARIGHHCCGFSFTIMYLVLPQFGTGSV